MSSPISSAATAAMTSSRRAGSMRSTLLIATATGTSARVTAPAMKRSPGPTPSWPLITSSATSDSLSSATTRRCMRSVSMSRGRCTPGRSTSTSCVSPAIATPRIARRVVCGLSETIAILPPTMLLTSVDLPTFGRPASATNPERLMCSFPCEELALEREHLAVVGLVIHARQVQGPVDDGLAEVRRVRRADHDVAELARDAVAQRLVRVDREAQDVRRRLLADVLGGERGDPV